MAGTVVINSSTMIRGFVSRKYAAVVSRNLERLPFARASTSRPSLERPRSVSRRAVTHSATSVAQIVAASATCAVTAAGRSSDQTFAAPTSTCAAISTSAIPDSHDSAGIRGAIHVLMNTYRTSSAESAASTRCRNIHVAAPPSAGTSRPSMSGQSLNASPESVARTYVPTRSAPNVAMTVQPIGPTTFRPTFRSGAARRVRMANPYLASTAFATSTATSAMAKAKCSVTHAGSSSVRTTMPPSTACERTSGTAAIDSRRTLGVERRLRHATVACTTTSTTTMNATNRCEYSTHDSNVGYGSHRSGPHLGQLVQPRPEPVARTNPPTLNSNSVVHAVAIASLWKRVMRFGAVRRNDNSVADVASLQRSCDTRPTWRRGPAPIQPPTTFGRRCSNGFASASIPRWPGSCPIAGPSSPGWTLAPQS
jgi:hypothetical protein